MSESSARQSIHLSTPAGQSTDVAPGKVFSRVIVFRNAGRDTVRAVLDGSLPAGWSPIVPLPAVELGPGVQTSRLIAVHVPSSAPAGQAELSFVVSSLGRAVSNRLNVAVSVVAVRSVAISEMERPDRVRAGQSFRHVYSIVNTGNAPATAVFSVRSSADYPVSADPPALRLDPGETGMVEVFVHPRSDLRVALTHRLAMEAVLQDLVSGHVSGHVSEHVSVPDVARVSTPVEILPLYLPFEREPPTGLPVDLTLGASTEEGRTAGQLEAEIRPTTIGATTIQAIVRTPDIRRASSFGRQDRYAVTLGTTLGTTPGELRLGDHVWRSTDLLEIGQYGFGAGVETHAGGWSAGAHAMRSRHLFPALKQVAAYGAYRPTPRLGFELHSIARRQVEAGIAASAVAVVNPLPSVSLEAELAAGHADEMRSESSGIGAGSLARALRATGTHGRSSWSARYRSAGADFPGTVRDTETITGAASLFPVDRIRVQFQGRRQSRHFEPVGGARVEQTTSFWRAGTGPVLRIGRTGLTGMLHAESRSQSNGLSGPGRRERSLEAEAVLVHMRSSVRAGFRRGVTDVPTTGAPFTSADVSLASGLGTWSASLQASITDGPTFFNPVDQQRLSGSVSLSREGRSTRAAMTLYHSTDTKLDDRSFTTADVRISRRFTGGVDVGLRARHVSSSSARSLRDATLGIELGVPLDVPVPRTPESRLLQGRVVDAESGVGLEGVSLRLGSDGAVSDETGPFELRMPDGIAYLNIDRASIGLDRIPVAGFPMLIEPAGAVSESGLEIQVVRSAALAIDVTFPDPDQDRTLPSASPLTDAARAGMLVEARLVRLADGLGAEDVPRASSLRRRLLGRTSGVQLADLLPGEWVVRIVPGTIPDGYQSKPDSLTVVLTPGSSVAGVIEIAPRRRSIRIVSPGGGERIVLKPEGAAASDSIAVVKDAPPAADSTAAVAEGRAEGRAATPAAASTGLAAPARPPSEYVIQPGDMLSSIATELYESPRKWVRIWLANRDRMKHPADLVPGRRLLIPSGTPDLTSEEMSVLRAAGSSRGQR